MPRQEIFFSSTIEDRKIEIVKTYDQNFAREAFLKMDQKALDHLARSLALESTFDDSDIPPGTDPDYETFLWQAMADSAREDGNLSSFFIVIESKSQIENELFVSPDWPTAEAFVNTIEKDDFASD